MLEAKIQELGRLVLGGEVAFALDAEMVLDRVIDAVQDNRIKAHAIESERTLSETLHALRDADADLSAIRSDLEQIKRHMVGSQKSA